MQIAISIQLPSNSRVGTENKILAHYTNIESPQKTEHDKNKTAL